MERERKQIVPPPPQNPPIYVLKLRNVPTQFGSTTAVGMAAISTIGFEPSLNSQSSKAPDNELERQQHSS
jgi:hypothetical protein